MGNFPVSGGCLCGAVRYTLLTPAKSVEHCHCSMCRKVHGALCVSGAAVGKDQLRIDRGADNLATFTSSPGARRQFCRTCGCPRFMLQDYAPDDMYLMVATLDGGAHPGHASDRECHIYVGSKAEWEIIGDDLPRFDMKSEEIGLGAPVAGEGTE